MENASAETIETTMARGDMQAEITIEPDKQLVHVDGWTLFVPHGSEEPRITDEELARQLGYQRPRKLRDLIRRLISEGVLRDVSMRPTVGRIEKRGAIQGVEYRTVDVYELTKKQAYKVIAKSDTRRPTRCST